MMNIVQSSRQLPYTTYFYDNTDNRNNGKNGRNALCHKVTYNWDNKITVAERLSNENNKEAHLTLCQFRRICKVDYIDCKKCAGR